MKMQEQSSITDASVLALLIAKFLPPALGAAIMIAVDPPKTKRDLFARAFVAFAASYLFGDITFDLLQSFKLFAFLDDAKRTHHTAVDGFVGAVGWFIAGGFAVMLKRFRNKPMETIDDMLERVNKSKDTP